MQPPGFLPNPTKEVKTHYHQMACKKDDIYEFQHPTKIDISTVV